MLLRQQVEAKTGQVENLTAQMTDLAAEKLRLETKMQEVEAERISQKDERHIKLQAKCDSLVSQLRENESKVIALEGRLKSAESSGDAQEQVNSFVVHGLDIFEDCFCAAAAVRA